MVGHMISANGLDKPITKPSKPNDPDVEADALRVRQVRKGRAAIDGELPLVRWRGRAGSRH